MGEKKFATRWLIGILLFVFFGLAVYIRVGLTHDRIFAGGIIKFDSNDAYYFLRQIDSFVHNFPHLISFDPYLRYPNGFMLGSLNFFVYVLGGIIWFLGLGSPTTHMVNMISAYFPAVLGALTVIPVYFIGKILFDRKVATVAAALIAVLPGEFLGRSILGATDRDALEVLLATTAMLFFILAVNKARERQITFRLFHTQPLSVLTIPIVYSLLAGILLGLSLFTWRGSFFTVLVILAYLIVRSIINYFKDESFDHISFVGVLTFLVALLILGVASRDQLFLAALTISLLIPLVLSGLAWQLKHRRVKPAYYLLSVIGIGLIAIGIFYAASPGLFRSMLGQFNALMPAQTSATVTEMRSILFPAGHFTLAVIWDNFTTCFFLSLISLGVLIYISLKRSEIDHTLIIIWSLIMLAATLATRRIALFLTINVALLTGYLSIVLYYTIQLVVNRITCKNNDYVSSQLSMSTGFKASDIVKPSEAPPDLDYYKVLGVPRDATRKQIKKARQRLVSRYQASGVLAEEEKEKLKQMDKAYAVLSDPRRREAYDRLEYGAVPKKGRGRPIGRGVFQSAKINMAVAGIAIFFMVFFPNFKPISTAINQASSFAPSNAWYNSLSWLKDNTPAPFSDPDYYYELYKTPFYYPETAYGVIAWWDYGYWILQIGQRLPNCDPGGGSRKMVARFLTAQNESSADKIIRQLNSKYIVLDYETVIGKLNTIAVTAGSDEKFCDVYYQPQKNKMVPVLLFYPEYYRSLSVRLYNFNGDEVIPQQSTVISYEEKISSDGRSYREIETARVFTSYEEASNFISDQKSDNYIMVSEDPLISPVPLEALEHYKLVHSEESPEKPEFQVSSSLSNSVKIFEYTAQ
jgi:oligosaccharyl transferase (archaeosortase A-associated)